MEKSWVVAEVVDGAVGEIVNWFDTKGEALSNAKVGQMIALEHFDTVKNICEYTDTEVL